MNYQHYWADGDRIELPLGKTVCAGLNYALHAKEMNSQAPLEEPVLFIKPSTALRPLAEPIRIPSGKGAVHHELEIAVLIRHSLCNASETEALQAVSGVGIGLDLTLRDLQSQLKKAGRPWEKAKAFDGSCPLSRFLPIGQCSPLNRLAMQLRINGQSRQEGNSRDMLFPIPRLLAEISRHFTLLPGDVVLTGTPEGVGALSSGDKLECSLDSQLKVSTVVV